MNAALRQSAITLATCLVACGGGTAVVNENNPESSTTVDDSEAQIEWGGEGHILPLGDSTEFALTGAPHLNYYGGPVITSVKVFPVYWNSRVNNQSQLNAFYSTITNSVYFDWLNEYRTPSQTIGRGRLAGSLVDPGPPAGNNINDRQIQAEISRLISIGRLPAPDANTYYPVHFPAGISITMGSSRSCVQFCAYHSTFRRNNVNVYYGVMPDLSGGCANGCGRSTYFNNSTSVSSHELVETVTDAAVGLATTLGPPLAWYDPNNGEIGDICNGQQAAVAGYTVQLQWSNSQNRCRAQ